MAMVTKIFPLTGTVSSGMNLLWKKSGVMSIIGCIKSMRRAFRDDLGPPASFVCQSVSSSTVEEKENTQICFVLSFGI